MGIGGRSGLTTNVWQSKGWWAVASGRFRFVSNFAFLLAFSVVAWSYDVWCWATVGFFRQVCRVRPRADIHTHFSHSSRGRVL